MKPILVLTCCGAAATVVACLITVVYTRGQSEPSQAAAPLIVPAPTNAGPQSLSVPYRLNLSTWEITRTDGMPVDAVLNSPQAIESRRLANLAAVDPAQYAQLFPKTEAQLAAMAKAQDEIENPRSLQQRLAEIQDPAELAKWTNAIEAISHPVPLTDQMIQAAAQNDPNGPWAILRNH